MDIQSKWYVVTNKGYEGYESYAKAVAVQAKYSNDHIGSVVLLTTEAHLVPRIDEIRANLVMEEATA